MSSKQVVGFGQFLSDVKARRWRYRQAIGGMFVVFLVVLADPTPWLMLAGGIGCALGAAMRLWAAGYLFKNEVLETRGPYSLVRHPQYLGNCLLAAGFSLATGRPEALLVWALLFMLFYLPAIRREDEKLARRFGETWTAWRERTPAIVPVRLPDSLRQLRFSEWSVRQTLRNGEPLWLLGLGVAFACVALHAH